MYLQYRKPALVAFCLAAMMTSGPAQAQAWIGLMVGNMMAQQQAALQERNCMMGIPMPEKEINEARKPGLEIMVSYWTHVKGGGISDASADFHLDKKTRWFTVTQSADLAHLNAITDPFAAARLTFDPDPLAFFRAGDGQSAAGQWIVRDGQGKRSGTYNASFKRHMGVWKLTALELVSGKDYVDPLLQYCHKVADVLPYRLSNAAWLRSFAQKRAIKAETKAAEAARLAAAAQASATAASRSAKASREANAKLAADKATAAAEVAVARKADLARAVAEDEAAKSDAAALEQARVAGRAALATP